MAELLPYGLASVHAPQEALLALGKVAGLPDGTPLPLALVCDDLHVLKGVAMQTRTVIACPVAGVGREMAEGSLVPLTVKDAPQVMAQLAVVSLRGRTLSAMAEFAVGFLGTLARGQKTV